jgi:hypothetical protein
VSQSPTQSNDVGHATFVRLTRDSVRELVLTFILLFGVTSIVRWVIGPSPISRAFPEIHAELWMVGALSPAPRWSDSQSSRTCLGSPQAAAQQDGECGVVSLSAKATNIYRPQKALTLLRGKPIPNRYTQPFGTLHAANTSRQIGAQEPAIRCLVRQPPDCRKPQVDRCRCIMPLFE